MTTTCRHENLVDGYYGHDCADCGELVYPYGCAPWDIGDDDEWEDWRDDERPETTCIDCGRVGIDACQCCGGWLCGRCSEVGAGFCESCPTQEWIDEQQDDAAPTGGQEEGR